jgi:serine/threonine protein kinase
MPTDSKPAQDPLIGHQVGRYAIRAYVGEEELGKVYAANELPGNRVVSVKVLHPHLSENREAFGRFGREMMATAMVNHPNTVQMLDFGDHRGVFHYIVLEHVDARTLADELAAKRTLPVERVAHIAAQIASALDAAHKESIIHRNLAPNNILLLNNAKGGDYVKIRDFGLSRLQSETDEDVDLTAVGTRVGTNAYMAPEYIMASVVDPKGDLYALGALMFEMLTGSPPYTGKTSAVLEAHVSGPIPRPSSKAKVPPWMDDLVVKLLQKEPFERPRSGAEVIAALQKGTGKKLDAASLEAVDLEQVVKRRETAREVPEASGGSGGAAAGMAIGVGLVVLGLAIVTLIVAVVAALVLF